jgi:hypothetical protein
VVDHYRVDLVPTLTIFASPEARKIAPGVHSCSARDTARHPSGDGFLAEPFTIESLTGIVERALS